MIELSVVSGTFNRFEMLKRMVYSVRSSAAGISYEIILVDAGSTDGTLEWARQQSDVRLIEHGTLYGAIKAYNDGAALAQGEYVVFSNDDLSFDKDALPIALTYMYDHPETGIGLFQTNRSHHQWHVAEMPAHYPDGRMTISCNGGTCQGHGPMAAITRCAVAQSRRVGPSWSLLVRAWTNRTLTTN